VRFRPPLTLTSVILSPFTRVIDALSVVSSPVDPLRCMHRKFRGHFSPHRAIRHFLSFSFVTPGPNFPVRLCTRISCCAQCADRFCGTDEFRLAVCIFFFYPLPRSCVGRNRDSLPESTGECTVVASDARRGRVPVSNPPSRRYLHDALQVSCSALLLLFSVPLHFGLAWTSVRPRG